MGSTLVEVGREKGAYITIAWSKAGGATVWSSNKFSCKTNEDYPTVNVQGIIFHNGSRLLLFHHLSFAISFFIFYILYIYTYQCTHLYL